MRVPVVIGALVIVATVASAQQQAQPAQFSKEWYAQFSGPYSAPAEPFRIKAGQEHIVDDDLARFSNFKLERIHILAQLGHAQHSTLCTKAVFVCAHHFKFSHIPHFRP